MHRLNELQVRDLCAELLEVCAARKHGDLKRILDAAVAAREPVAKCVCLILRQFTRHLHDAADAGVVLVELRAEERGRAGKSEGHLVVLDWRQAAMVLACSEEGNVHNVLCPENCCALHCLDVIDRLAVLAACNLNLLWVKYAGLNHFSRWIAKGKDEGVPVEQQTADHSMLEVERREVWIVRNREVHPSWAWAIGTARAVNADVGIPRHCGNRIGVQLDCGIHRTNACSVVLVDGDARLGHRLRNEPSPSDSPLLRLTSENAIKDSHLSP